MRMLRLLSYTTTALLCFGGERQVLAETSILGDDITTKTQRRKKPKLMPAPVVVGGVQPLEYVPELNNTISPKQDAYQVRLPWTVTTVVGDYCINSGICHFFRDEILARDDDEEAPGEFLTTSNDGALWYLQNSTATDQHNLHYLHAENESALSQLWSALALGGFDPVLESVGQHFGLDAIRIYSMGFVGATYSNSPPVADDPTPLNSHLLPLDVSGNSRSYQMLIPMGLKKGTRPELQVHADGDSTIKLPSEMDAAWLFGDQASYGPATFDYRDSPGDVYLAFAVYFVDSTSGVLEEEMQHLPKVAQEQLQGDREHWKKDGSERLPRGESSSLDQESCDAELGHCKHTSAYYDWRKWTFSEFKENLECKEYYDDPTREPPTEALWKTLRQQYKAIVGDENSTLHLPLSSDHDSFHVQVESRLSPGKGRGIFAKEFIPKGTLVYRPAQQARFFDGDSYKKLLMSVSVEAACDLLMWSSIQEVDLEGVTQPPAIVIDLDNGAMVNSGFRSENMTLEEIQAQTDEPANVGCVPEMAEGLPGQCSENDFALADIQVGEELLIDYEEYTNTVGDVWVAFGLKVPNEDDEDDDFDDNGDFEDSIEDNGDGYDDEDAAWEEGADVQAYL